MVVQEVVRWHRPLDEGEREGREEREGGRRRERERERGERGGEREREVGGGR